MTKKIHYIIVLLLLCPLFGAAQEPSVQTTLDRDKILIGEPVTLNIKATVPGRPADINWFMVPDSMAHFELISTGKIDTLLMGSNTMLSQVVRLTSFDSGRWPLPAFAIRSKASGGMKLYTDTLPVSVGFEADTTNQLRDIKPILEVQPANNWWKYVLAGIVALLLILGAWLLYRRLNRKEEFGGTSGRLTAYGEAIRELEKLKQLNLQLPDDVRQYHSGLSLITRQFLSRMNGTNLLNKTTGDVLLHLKELQTEPALLANVAASLRSGDAVKFAKYLPLSGDNETCMAAVRQLIETMVKTLKQ